MSSDVFYDPDTDRFRRWAERGHLGVEMEAAVLYTIAALRGVEALTMLTVSDTLYGEPIVRISDDELRQGVDRMMELAARSRWLTSTPPDRNGPPAVRKVIDEYRLYVHPVLIGRGRPLFEPADALTALRLAEARHFGNGVVLLRDER